MWPQRDRFQELKRWLGSHKILVISALNAALFLFLTCFLALLIEVSARKGAYAQVGTAAARSREAAQPTVSAPAATPMEKSVSSRRHTTRRVRPSQPEEPPVHLGHRDYPVEVRERSILRSAPEPTDIDPTPATSPDRSAGPEAPEGEPEAGVPPEGMTAEGTPAEGMPAEGETDSSVPEATR